MATRTDTKRDAKNLVEMNWDPVTRIVGNLGIYTRIDFENRESGRRTACRPAARP